MELHKLIVVKHFSCSSSMVTCFVICVRVEDTWIFCSVSTIGDMISHGPQTPPCRSGSAFILSPTRTFALADAAISWNQCFNAYKISIWRELVQSKAVGVIARLEVWQDFGRYFLALTCIFFRILFAISGYLNIRSCLSSGSFSMLNSHIDFL